MSGRDEWRWTDEQGVQRLVRTEELRAALASNVLPPTTLVWREGMKEWVAAESLPEFAAAAAGARPRPPHASSATGDRATPTDVMKVASGAAQEGARARIQTLVGISSAADPHQANVPPLPIVVPGGTGTEPRSVITQLPRFSPDLIASAGTSIPRAPRVPSGDASGEANPGAERTPGGTQSAVRKPGTSDIDGLWAGRSEPPGAHAPAAGATSPGGASTGATSPGGASTGATSPGGASTGASSDKPAGPGKDKGAESTPFAAVADDPTDRAEDKSPAVAATATDAAPARAPAASEDDAPTEKRTTTDVMPAAARRPTSQRPPPLNRPPADSIELDDVLLADAVERSVTGPSHRPGSESTRRPPPVPSRKPTVPPKVATSSIPARSPSARPPPPPPRKTGQHPSVPPPRDAAPGASGSPPARERVHTQKPPPVRPPLKPTATPASATPLPSTGTPPGWKSETVKLGSVSSKDAPPVTTSQGASGTTTGKPPPLEAKRTATDTAVRTLRGAGRPAGGKLGDLLMPDSGDNRGSTEPPLVGKLQQPASSVASSAEPVPAAGSGQAAEGNKPAVTAGAQTANMPAVVDPASPSWSPSTGPRPPGGASKAPAAKDEEARSKPATPPPKPELGAQAVPEAARAQQSDPPQRPSGEHDDVVRAELPLPPQTPLPRFDSQSPPRRESLRAAAMRAIPTDLALDQQVQVPFSSLLFAAGTLIVMVVCSFLVGRCSMGPEVAQRRALRSMRMVPLMARAALPAPPKPCWVAKQPVMWAAEASKSIPFELVATEGGTLAMGYARDQSTPIGIEVDPSSGEVKPRFNDKLDKHEIERVSPTGTGVGFVVASTDPSSMRQVVHVAGARPFAVGVAGEALALAEPPDGTPAPLWPGSGAGVNLLLVQPAGEAGYAVVVRKDTGVWGGWLGADRKPVGELVQVVGSGGSVGKPMAGWNGRGTAVVFADRPRDGGTWEIRVGRSGGASIPTSTVVIPLPKGGPGGDAFAPDITGLPDGRWLLVWTEGPAGSRAMRALTLAPDLTPIGDAIALSPPAGNFGQGVLGVVGDYAAAVFLQKGRATYELWGAILKCG